MKPRYARLTVVAIAAVVALWLISGGGRDPDAVGLGRCSLDGAAAKLAVSCLAMLFCYVVLGGRAWKVRLARAVLSVTAVLLTLAAVELPAFIGWIDYRALLSPKAVGGVGPRNRRLDRELVFCRPPLDRFESSQPGDWTISLGIATDRRYQVEYCYDQNGFRNPAQLQRAPVVLLGDSFVEGYHVPQEKTCAAELRRMLEVDVANLGQADYGPPQELAVLRRFAFGLRPRVVVWFFFEGNDLYDLEDYSAVQANWPQVVEETNGFSSRSFLRNALDLLAIKVDLLRRADSPLARRRSARLPTEVSNTRARMYFEVRPFGIRSRERRLINNTRQLLREAGAGCDWHGVKLLVVYVPIKFRVYRELCTVAPDSDLLDWQLNDLPDHLKWICRAEGIRFLDLTPVLQAAAAEGPIVYLLDDGHWSPHGNAVAAQAIAELIQEAGWLDADCEEGM